MKQRWLIPPLLVLSMACQAQGFPPGGGGGAGSGVPERSRTRSAAVPQNPNIDTVATSMSALESQIQLNPTQQTAWQAYQEKVGRMMADQGRQSATPEDWDALKKIEQKVDTVRNRLAAMEDVADAARRFYQTLTPDQKKQADNLLPPTLPALYSGGGTPRNPGGEDNVKDEGKGTGGRGRRH